MSPPRTLPLSNRPEPNRRSDGRRTPQGMLTRGLGRRPDVYRPGSVSPSVSNASRGVDLPSRL
jgi:hypothetical protein